MPAGGQDGRPPDFERDDDMIKPAHLPIPRKALDQNVILLGKTRSGKSSTLRVIVENLLAEKQRTCIITPKDDWWGLKLGADGKSAGCPVVIFGGRHADVPITEHAGAQIAKLVATGNRPCVIVLAGLSHRARTKFFIDFADALFRLNEGPIYLVIDECHNFTPKGRVSDFEQGEMLYWANKLASEGLGLGIMLLSASQRPQKVHNDYLTSHETLIAKRVVHASDRKAYQDWIDGCGDPAVGKTMIGALAGLSRSQAYAWSPEIGFGPQLVEFPFFATYDSFKPQKPGSSMKLKGWASIDLKDVREQLATVIEEAKANDPVALRAENADLRKQLSAKNVPIVALPAPPDAGAMKRAIDVANAEIAKAFRLQLAQVIQSTEDEQREKMRDAAAKIAEGVADRFVAMVETVGARFAKVVADAKLPGDTIRAIGKDLTKTAAVPAAAQPLRLAPPVKVGSGEGATGLSKGARTLLAAIVQHPDGLTSEGMTVICGYKKTSRNEYLRQLFAHGNLGALIVLTGDRYKATEAGMRALGSYERLPTGDALREYWLIKLTGGEHAIFAYLSSSRAARSRDEIEQSCGYKKTSTNEYVRKLRARGLVVGADTGSVRAADMLFG